jgi:hypothetical protein
MARRALDCVTNICKDLCDEWQPSDLDCRFRSRSGIYRIIGVLPSRPKFSTEGDEIHAGRRLLFPSLLGKAGLFLLSVVAAMPA